MLGAEETSIPPPQAPGPPHVSTPSYPPPIPSLFPQEGSPGNTVGVGCPTFRGRTPSPVLPALHAAWPRSSSPEIHRTLAMQLLGLVIRQEMLRMVLPCPRRGTCSPSRQPPAHVSWIPHTFQDLRPMHTQGLPHMGTVSMGRNLSAGCPATDPRLSEMPAKAGQKVLSAAAPSTQPGLGRVQGGQSRPRSGLADVLNFLV